MAGLLHIEFHFIFRIHFYITITHTHTYVHYTCVCVCVYGPTAATNWTIANTCHKQTAASVCVCVRVF